MANPEQRQRILAFFEERFGIPPEVFDPYELIVRGRNIWIVARSPHLRQAFSLVPHTVGLRLARETNLGIKPTSYGLQVFGHRATKNRVQLSREQAVRFLRGEELNLEADTPPEPGFVVVSYEGDVLGCGLYKTGGLLFSLIPKKVRLDAPRPDADTV